jgi:antitoxin component YwqK of YwqJK toxin-antitoxin module
MGCSGTKEIIRNGINGNIYDKYYEKNGKKHGEYKSWYGVNNPITSYNYLENKFMTVYVNRKIEKEYDKRQQFIISNYKEGKLEGKYRYWYENGKLSEMCNYKEGKIEGEWKSWYDNGVQKIICNYKNGKIEGEWKGWYDNGNPMIVSNFKDDKLHGEYKCWCKINKKLIQYSYYMNSIEIIEGNDIIKIKKIVNKKKRNKRKSKLKEISLKLIMELKIEEITFN